MKNSIKTLALSSALVAFTVGIAGAQGSTPASTPAATSTATTDAKPMAKSEKMAKTMKAPKWTADQVKAAQEALAKGGYYKGEATGKWNGATTKALKGWQKANKMKADGKMTEDVMTKLQAS